ncbi:hypothetical protein BDD43_0314 [Mucilaginibacter gracilis]|uniref:Uncharacterized protein n=1 Tax=Mucilaginibacter gracilis TaxID=423350 RepID=A0A495IW39_9SPHI|nr:hypothetical protein BDD43_0314 [Mucilaginibacter gracilis]
MLIISRGVYFFHLNFIFVIINTSNNLNTLTGIVSACYKTQTHLLCYTKSQF